MCESVSKRLYENKVRARVCGILIENDSLLLLKHNGIGSDGFIWSPPGGGIEFDEDAYSALKKEFIEETGLEVTVGKFLFVNEYKNNKHHAIELFFEVKRLGGKESLGYDPEVPESEQILSELKWISFSELNKMSKQHLHNIFSELDHPSMIAESTGFYKFGGISNK